MFRNLKLYSREITKPTAATQGIRISISISISIIYLPSGTRGVVAQSPEPGAHDKSD